MSDKIFDGKYFIGKRSVQHIINSLDEAVDRYDVSKKRVLSMTKHVFMASVLLIDAISVIGISWAFSYVKLNDTFDIWLLLAAMVPLLILNSIYINKLHGIFSIKIKDVSDEKESENY